MKQAGSLVAPDRLRFDFSHYAAVTPDEIEQIEALANEEVLANDRVRVYETTKAEAEAMGAIAFFGDKYGDVVRVLEAGRNSLELCGGTHVRALGDIGTIKVVSEGSIGSNLRRIEAVTGMASVELLQRDERELAEAAGLLSTTPGRARRGRAPQAGRDQGAPGRAPGAAGHAPRPAGRPSWPPAATDGLVVARVDDLAAGRPPRPRHRRARAAGRATPSCSAAAATPVARRSSPRSRRELGRPGGRPAPRRGARPSRAAAAARATWPSPAARTRPASTRPCAIAAGAAAACSADGESHGG